ncbi:adenylyl-sulfate kinase [Deefgea salmonis]|uniref:Adenylyl-sulfate kinase n=1 Tax=Deefgea salmonis TaxID=2875502 RepID=A0ABS8BNS0_9NEIS|nr:adenylyl-sulfate kinase [Deefgea salmonis]MCB5197382.1 adenylyl-sulfate kinase [Deefgea salmonis]
MHITTQKYQITAEQRAKIKNQKPFVIWFTGISGAGKSTLADWIDEKLHAQGYHTVVLDGDNLRQGLNSGLSFSMQDRHENIRRAGQVAKLMHEAGLIVICAFISPFAVDRQQVRALFGDKFIEIHLDMNLESAKRNDQKGLYALAASGKINNLTGVGSDYEVPADPELRINTDEMSIEQSGQQVFDLVLSKMNRSVTLLGQ